MLISETYKNRLLKLAGIEILYEAKQGDIIITKEKLLKDISKFIKGEFYDNVNYENLLNSCDLSKGNCSDVTEDLEKYLLSMGYKSNDIIEVELYNPKFNLDNAHFEWKDEIDKKNILHVILKVGDFYVDLTGSQFSPEQSGIKIYNKKEIHDMWNIIEYKAK